MRVEVRLIGKKRSIVVKDRLMVKFIKINILRLGDNIRETVDPNNFALLFDKIE